jgi:hypothetical protein
MPRGPLLKTAANPANISIAVLYAQEDEAYWKELEKQFASIKARYSNVRIWTATDVEVGGEVTRVLKDELRRADITLLLFSPEFVNDEIIDAEVRELLDMYSRYSNSEEYRSEERFIMPILLDHLHGWDDIYDDHFDIENLRVFDKIPEAPEERGVIYTAIADSLQRYVERVNAKAVQIALPTWIGFIPSIMYNGGFARNEHTELFKQYKREVHFQLNDHLDQLCDDMLGGQIDMMWCTIDRLPFVADRLLDLGPKIFYQASWSNGADAILSRKRIKSPADLKGKKILYPKDSPSHTFLNFILRENGITPKEVEAIPQQHTDLDLLTKRFVNDDSIDALVLWSPFVEACIAEGEDIKILVDSSSYPNLIADVLVTTQEYINLNEEEILTLLQGWFREVDCFLNDKYYEGRAIGVLVEAIIKPLPSIIPSSIRGSLEEALNSYFHQSLQKVHLCDLEDNQRFFGIGQAGMGEGERLYQTFLERQYPHLAKKSSLQWPNLVNTELLEHLVSPSPR